MYIHYELIFLRHRTFLWNTNFKFVLWINVISNYILLTIVYLMARLSWTWISPSFALLYSRVIFFLCYSPSSVKSTRNSSVVTFVKLSLPTCKCDLSIYWFGTSGWGTNFKSTWRLSKNALHHSYLYLWE